MSYNLFGSLRKVSYYLTTTRLGDPDQIHVFLIDHIQMNHFREKLVNLYIEQGKLEKAKTLCQEWLNDQSSGHHGDLATFHDLLLQIAQLEEDIRAILICHDNF